MSREELEKRLAVLREGFRDDLGQRLEDISAAWATIQDAGWNDENAELLERLLHSLAGPWPPSGSKRSAKRPAPWSGRSRPYVQENRPARMRCPRSPIC